MIDGASKARKLVRDVLSLEETAFVEYARGRPVESSAEPLKIHLRYHQRVGSREMTLVRPAGLLRGDVEGGIT